MYPFRLEAGADALRQDADGETPAHKAAAGVRECLCNHGPPSAAVNVLQGLEVAYSFRVFLKLHNHSMYSMDFRELFDGCGYLPNA
jgi:hypothetical protein